MSFALLCVANALYLLDIAYCLPKQPDGKYDDTGDITSCPKLGIGAAPR